MTLLNETDIQGEPGLARGYGVLGKQAPTNASGLIPVEFFVVVALDPAEEKTAGGIILPTQVQDKDKLAAQEGRLIAVSPLAFNYDNWPPGSRKPEVGDKVLFKRYQGHLIEREIEGQKRAFKLMSDKDIMAILEGNDG